MAEIKNIYKKAAGFFDSDWLSVLFLSYFSFVLTTNVHTQIHFGQMRFDHVSNGERLKKFCRSNHI